MRRTREVAFLRGAFLAGVAIAVSAATWHLSTTLHAQAASVPSGAPNLTGAYQRVGRFGGDGEWVLNPRAKALIAAFDESAGPKWDCVAATSPRIITDPYNFRIEQQADRVLLHYEKDDVTRTVWLDGHGHAKPKTGEYFLQGYSTGRYEGNQLVVETSKFTYDPQGMTDSSPFIPSSQRKKVTERYWREGKILKADVVVEDPLILRKPNKFSSQWELAEFEWVPFDCDIATSHEILKFLPPKYDR